MFLNEKADWLRIGIFLALAAMSILFTRMNQGVALIWMANAAAIFLSIDKPVDRIWRYALAFFTLNVLVNLVAGDSVRFSLVAAAANQIEIWTVVFLLKRFAGPDIVLPFEMRVLRIYALLTAGPLASSLLGVPLIVSEFGGDIPHGFAHWFVADYISLIIIGGIFIHWRNFPDPNPKRPQIVPLELPALFAGMGLLFFIQFSMSGQWYLTAVLPAMWAALRLPDMRGAVVIGLVGLGMILTLPAAFANAPAATADIKVLEAQIIVGIIALAGHVVHQLNCFKFRVIAELESRNRELEESRELANLAGEIGQIGHWRLDIRAGTLAWDSHMHKIHGTDPATFKPGLENVAGLYMDGDLAALKKSIRNRTSQSEFEFVTQLRRLDGTARTAQTIGRVVAGEDGEPAIAYGVLQDITDRKREEELQRAYSELERFSYACSHDLSEPTRLLSVLTDMLIADEGPAPDPERAEILDSINRNARRLNELVTNLLAFSRAGTVPVGHPVDLDAIGRDTAEALSLLVAERQATLSAAGLGQALGSDVLFRQIFQNLMSNSLRHARFAGPAELGVDRITDREGLHLVFWDNGAPVSDHVLARINEALESQTSDMARRKGLGLWITSSIVRKQGGRIWFGKGDRGRSEFHVLLPGQAGEPDGGFKAA